MTNLPQGPGSFFAAMECVIDGGKAWRESWTSGAYLKKGIDRQNSKPNTEVIDLWIPGRSGAKKHTAWMLMYPETMEATDWVCEPKEGG